MGTPTNLFGYAADYSTTRTIISSVYRRGTESPSAGSEPEGGLAGGGAEAGWSRWVACRALPLYAPHGPQRWPSGAGS
jgi:hypothetical protein